MRVQLPYYLVALAAAFVYAIIKNYVPSLPLTEEQVLWAVIAILTLLNVDITQALRKQGVL